LVNNIECDYYTRETFESWSKAQKMITVVNVCYVDYMRKERLYNTTVLFMCFRRDHNNPSVD